MKRVHAMPFGAELKPDGATRFRIWAPAAKRVEIELDAHGERLRIAMHPLEQGWHELVQPRVGAGARYRFVLEDGLAVPDPASRFNPQDVHSPSEVIDPGAYAWRDAGWRGLRWEKAVLYELQVGTFTREGSFAAACSATTSIAAAFSSTR